MGRPRKRQFIESEKEPVNVQNNNIPFDLGQMQFDANDFDNYNAGNIAEPYYINQSAIGIPPEVTHHGIASKPADGRNIWHFGDGQIIAGPPIDFGSLNGPPMDDGIPSLSDPSTTVYNSSTTDSDNSSSQSMPTLAGPCGCLASMYLALSSLQTFPSDIVSALRTVRSAAGTAAQSIWCPQCGAVVLENPNPPIESFQNTMLLGTILPIIANGYARLLKMIDDETDLAVSLGETKTFKFHEYGGMCGKQEDIESAVVCLEKEMFFNAVEMPPNQWRNTVRAMLRVDIYGHEEGNFKHKGLKDLVAEMERRQMARHELLDSHVRAGGIAGMGPFSEKICLGEQSYGCLQILKMAKIAIDNLTIP
jgi:hypothetical protein